MNFTLSNIIGSTLDPRPQFILQKNLSVILRYDEGLEAHCVFWDFTAKSNFNGSWSSKGCSVVNRTKTEITCTCNHLTNFAVLMHVGVDNEVPADHKVALKVITYVGCALSLIGEALTAVAYCVLMDLKEDQTQIHFNLVVAIAIAQITFLAGIDATEVKELCVFVAAMIHYFYLVGFAWMLFEGVYLYLMVVKVFNTVMRWRLFYGVAWGVSLLIVVLSIVIASIQDGGIESYVHDHFCWVSFKNNLIWTFVAPVLLVCTINSVLLARVVHEILRMQADKTSHLERVRQGVKACVVLFPLLGLTWVFGVLSVTDAGLVFQYIFTIFNSLQGLFIFILHVLRNSDVRAAYSRKMQKRNAAKSVKNSQENRNTIGLWSSTVTNEPSCTKEPSSASLRSSVGVKSKIDNALHEEGTMTPVDT
ncbi:adhesion G-protein coupled receptor D1-like [Porites lutea]|uniref:adhesion G-protein coupled receptor D1-like n=1 Tax=Porites lutea TaxID=51062 RepID=UPI003CC66E2E